MNCSRCASELPPGGAYCPICGAPRRNLDYVVAQMRTAADETVEATVGLLNRASKEMEPAIDRVFRTLQPIVRDVGKALQPLADSSLRVANDVADALRPAAQRTGKVARDVAGRTAATIRPFVEKASQQTGAAWRRVREGGRKLG